MRGAEMNSFPNKEISFVAISWDFEGIRDRIMCPTHCL
jgi:hypothetical protein